MLRQGIGWGEVKKHEGDSLEVVVSPSRKEARISIFNC